MRTYNIQTVANGRGNDYTNSCLLHYPYLDIIKW